VRWVIGNIPIDYHKCVVRADLSPGEARRQGIGAALTLAPQESREMGYPVYRRLGLREHCRIGLC
jgi:hypothetical protein